jgi:hypothetical protein
MSLTELLTMEYKTEGQECKKPRRKGFTIRDLFDAQK